MPPESPQHSPDAPSRGIPRWLAVSGVAVLALTLVGWFLDRAAQQPPTTPPRSTTTAPRTTTAGGTSSNPGYVGVDSCIPCHESRVAEFKQTNHFRTCRVPVAEDVPSAFNDANATFTARFPGTRFQLQQIGDGFFQTTIRDTPAGEQVTSTRIDLVYGAGKTDDIYLAWDDDERLHELPIAWLWPLSRLGASHFLHRYGSGDFSRSLTVRCLECHSTWVDYQPGTENHYRRDTAILGVNCENCHGPAREHIAWHEAHPQADFAEAIILPSALERERLIEVCTQCHSNAVTHRKAPYSYVPGEPLDEYYITQLIAHPEDDHVANQIQHLRQSACFQQSPDMTCITCHDPHHNELPSRSQAHSCRQCHEPHDCGEQAALPAELRDRCTDCHMARRLKINVKFDMGDDNFVPATSRSRHRIAVDPVARDEVLLKWHRSSTAGSALDGSALSEDAAALQQRLRDHWMAEAETHRQEQRYLAAIGDVREAIAVEDSPELRESLAELVAIQSALYDDWAHALHLISENRMNDAVGVLQEILKVRPNDAEAHLKLGTIFAMSGRRADATEHLLSAARLDPNSAGGFGVLGRQAWVSGQFAEALDYWTRAAEIEPFLAQIQFDLGQVLLKLNRPDEALPHLERAAAIDPTRPDIRQLLRQLSTTQQ